MSGRNLTAGPAPMLPGMIDEKHISDLIRSFQIEQDAYKGPIYLNRLPTAVERQMLQNRNRDLIENLKPYGVGVSNPPCDVRRYMAGMFRGYTSLRQEEAMDLLDAAMLVLHRYPKFAIIAAIDDVLGGRLKGMSDRFPPNSAQLGRAAADHQAKLGMEQAQIDKILRAERTLRAVENSAASRAKIVAGFKDLSGRLRVGAIAGTLTDEDRQQITARQKLEARQMILKEWAHLGIAPIYSNGAPISVAMAKQMGKLIEFKNRDGVSYSVPREEMGRD